MVLTASVVFGARSVSAETASDLVRETLRQQSAAEFTGCTGIQRVMTMGTDATLVVRTAIELGYNPCQVIRCALGKNAVPGGQSLCEKVIRGAVAAGVQPDVISRCSSEACESSAVAALLAATLLEPNYCYFIRQPLVAPAPLPSPEPVISRDYPRAQASPYTF